MPFDLSLEKHTTLQLFLNLQFRIWKSIDAILIATVFYKTVIWGHKHIICFKLQNLLINVAVVGKKSTFIELENAQARLIYIGALLSVFNEVFMKYP